MKRLVYVSDSKLVEEIKNDIKANKGYCISQLEKTKLTKCKCKYAKNLNVGEICLCGLYQMIEESEEY